MKLTTLRIFFNMISHYVDAVFLKVQYYIKQNKNLIYTLSLLALAAYGFELFNFNLTIDEEVHATYTAPTLDWILQGRWGMYLLNKFVLPYSVIPFIPLLVALVFHIGAILLILNSWEVESKLEQFIIGAVCITFPIMAYLYTFSTINYGIGMGLFFVAASLFIYTKNTDWKRWLAIVPSTITIAIYQGFIPVLIAVFLIHIILIAIRFDQVIVKDITVILFIHILAFSAYFVIQQLFVVFLGIVPNTSYISGYFDLAFFKSNFGAVLNQLFRHLILPVYFGGKSVYVIDIGLLGVLLFVSLLSLGVNLFSLKMSLMTKTLVIISSVGLLLLPFGSGIFMRGMMSMRFLIAVPIAFSGIIMLGMLNSSRSYKIFVAVLTGYCVFQFTVSTNRLFASSYLALQADRVLATRLIGKIEDAQSEAGVKELHYMEIIGYYSRPSTELIPKIETFGASFFEWNQGTAFRILPFLETLGFPELQSLPIEKRGEMVEIANSMPVWPEAGSVKVVGDVVLVKFGPYSDAQRQTICSSEQDKQVIQIEDFCK